MLLLLGSSPGSCWHLLQGGGQQHPGCQNPPQEKGKKKKSNLSLHGPSPPAHLPVREFEDGNKQQEEPHLHHGFNSHTHSKLSFQRAFILLGCSCIPPRTPEAAFQGSSSLQPWCSQPSIPSCCPPGQHRHNSMLTQSHYRVTMPHFCPWALIPHQATHLETWNSFPEIRHWGWGGEGIIHSCPYPPPDCRRKQPSCSPSVTSASHSLTLCPTTSSTGMPAPRWASRPPKGGFGNALDSKGASPSLPGGCVLAQLMQPSC